MLLYLNEDGEFVERWDHFPFLPKELIREHIENGFVYAGNTPFAEFYREDDIVGCAKGSGGLREKHAAGAALLLLIRS